MKRYVVLGVVGTMLLSCCGCASMIMPDLTASEFDKVAEFAAYTLLENTDGYESKLLSEDEVQRELEERKLAAEIEAALDALNKPGGSTGGNIDNPGVNPDGSGNFPDDIYDSDMTVADVLDIDGVTIEYAGSELTDLYPNDADALFSMKAAEGKKFLVLSFVLSNTGSEQADFNMLSKDAIYRITLEGATYRSLLTAFDNDLSTWSAPLAPGSVNMAFLIFQVPDELTADSIGDIEFAVRIDKTTRSIILK